MAEGDATQDTEPTVDELYEQVMTCEPALPTEDLDRAADMVRSNEFIGRPWRLTALLATKDGAFFRELSEREDQAKALAPAIEPLRDFAKTLRTMADLAECVSARVLVAGCNHKDFNKWADEAA